MKNDYLKKIGAILISLLIILLSLYLIFKLGQSNGGTANVPNPIVNTIELA